VNLEQRQPDIILQGGNGVVEDYFSDRALDVQFVENNTQLLSVTGEGIVRRWDAQTGALIAETQLGQSFYGAAFSPDGGQLVYGVTTRDGVQIVPTPTAVALANVPAPSTQQTTGSPYTPTADAVRAIDWHPDGVTLAKAMQNGAKVLAQNQGVEVRSIAWSPDGSQIALGGGLIYCGNDPDTDTRPYGITILDATTRQPITTFEGHVCAVNSVAWNFDGSKLASASDDGTARVWDTTTGQLLSVLQDSYGRGISVTGLVWSPDGQKLAHFVDMGRSPLIIWDPNTGETLTIIDVSNDVESLAWSPEGGMCQGL
jgi:WD40 repeat protein